MIKAVTFDFWETLFTDDESSISQRRDRRVALAQSFFAAGGRQLDSQLIRGAIEALVRKSDELHQAEQRAFSHIEAGRLLGVQLGFDLTDEQGAMLIELISAAGAQYPPVLLEGARELLSQLHGKVKVGIISDTGLTLGMHLRQVMDAHGLSKYVDQFTWSDETLTTKPMTRQFLFTVHMLGALPEESVHVGDLEHRDIMGAKSVGMRAIRIVSETGRHSQADATVPNISGVSAVLKRWGVEI